MERMSNKTVLCSKLKKELPALEKPPFGGELGEQIFQNVSKPAWDMWKEDMMIKIINEYRLNLADPEQYQTLLEQMKAFLGLGGEQGVLEVENAERGRKE
jgi:Fe-S cluster biosynthesis and repair protein YggX